MAYMQQIQMGINLLSDIADRSACRRFLAIVQAKGPSWTVTRFGAYEPLKKVTADTEPGALCEEWARPSLSGTSGDFHFRTSPPWRASGWVHWSRRPGNTRFNYISLRVAASSANLARSAELLALMDELFVGMNGVHGWIACSPDYDQQHRLSLPTGFKYVGSEPTTGIPGLYWANYFSASLSTFLGEDRVASTAAFDKYQLRNGAWVVLTCKRPDDWCTPETVTLRRALRASLGPDRFFDITVPSREVSVPVYNFSAVGG